MITITRRALSLLSVASLAVIAATAASAQEKKTTIAVSIPAATHGWTGGVV